MAETSFPFEGIDTSESQFGLWASTLAGASGVRGVPGDTNLLVSGDNSGMQVRVAAGSAIVRGHYYDNSVQATVAISAAPAAGYTRIDSVVLELDLSANSISLKVVAGTPATSGAVAPTMTQTETGIFQLRLADVTVAAGTSSITAGMVSDLRSFVANKIGIWTTATRPANPVANATIGFNATLGIHEVWNGSAWAPMVETPTSPFLLMGA